MRKSVRTVTFCVLLALTVLALPSSLFADTISVGDGWHQFSWQGGVGATQSEAAFSFTSTSATTVTVTDAYVYGDRFQLYDNGVLAGSTSAINSSLTPDWTSDPSAAVASGYSHATFNLGAGSHSLVLKTIQIAPGYSSGAGFVSVGAPGDGGSGSTAGTGSAPEPGTLALLGFGLTGLASRRLRRGLRKVLRREPAVATV